MSIYRADDFGEALKSDQSPVTRADIAAHHILIDGLTKLTKDIPVVSEEDSRLGCHWSPGRLLLADRPARRHQGVHQPERRVYLQPGAGRGPPTEARIRIGPGAGSALLSVARVSLEADQPVWGDVTVLSPVQRSDKTRVVASKSHLNAETQAFIDGIEGPTELVQAGSSLKFLKIAEGLADVY